MCDSLAKLALVIVGDFPLITFHSEGLARTSLSIGEDGPVITLDHSVNQIPAPHALVDVVLVIVRSKDLVESVLLPAAIEAPSGHHLLIVSLLIDNFDMSLVSYRYLSHLVPLHFLVLEHRPDSDANLDLGVALATASLLASRWR